MWQIWNLWANKLTFKLNLKLFEQAIEKILLHKMQPGEVQFVKNVSFLILRRKRDHSDLNQKL